MDAPVDLTNLREMTEGDAELEQVLFKEFCIAFEQGIGAMQAALAQQNTDEWIARAHSLKGIAVNLGAHRLGELCRKAQENGYKNDACKIILQAMSEEYGSVKEWLRSL